MKMRKKMIIKELIFQTLNSENVKYYDGLTCTCKRCKNLKKEQKPSQPLEDRFDDEIR